ncbi:MAG: IS66 family insertion sequence element accessory protein TnpB [Candidatus Thiodiazotropha sp. (ex Ustalcina ferruginea)]|nr:IS66 family insertion sequence element accessory protein TnpB [Candidatus Thiodiazotropha sp. (ex Ustalcina ferruginea)]
MAKGTQAEWMTLFSQQHTSGLSAAAFCRQHKLCPKYFSLRKKQLQWRFPKSGVVRRAAVPVFIPARVTQPTLQPLQLRWQSVELTLPTGLPAQWLSQLMKALIA